MSNKETDADFDAAQEYVDGYRAALRHEIEKIIELKIDRPMVVEDFQELDAVFEKAFLELLDLFVERGRP